MGTSLMPKSVPSLIEASTSALISGVAAQAATLAGSRPALVTALLRVSVAPSGVASPSWPSKTADAYWKNALLPPSLLTQRPYSAAVIAAGCMDGNGKALKDDARLGEIRDQLVHVGLRLLAMGALEIGELDQLKVF